MSGSNSGSDSDARNYSRILLLKRAAHETYFPNVFELPSGKVDLEDISIKHALVREVKEETGLDITDIMAELKPMIYSTAKMVPDAMGHETLISKSAIQLNYIVAVSEGDVQVNKHEHSESVWATEREVHELNVTREMYAVVKKAFDWTATQHL